jgi:aminodeoxyfutalosine synthase
MTHWIDTIAKKVDRHERITPEEGLELLQSQELIAMGELAHQVRCEKNGDHAYYIINRHFDYSNICELSCHFCAFAKKETDEAAFLHSIKDMQQKVGESVKEGITEVHMVGGLHPTLPWSYYLDMVRAIRELDPHLHIKAFTMVEIDFFAQKFGMTIEQVFQELMAAGLNSCPGGGAEIFAPRARRKICKDKIDGARWLEVMKAAHKVGLKSTCTMLYGHIETDEEIIDHLEKLRQLQDETNGFMAFIPLAFNPELSILGKVIRPTTGAKDLKMLALSRLYLDNFDHIKTYWITSGLEVAQLGLSYGADDLHGTVCEENIMHMAGASSPFQISAGHLQDMIRHAGFTPYQRDSFYNIIQ